MVNIVALIKDDRVRRAVELHLNELDMDIRFATFKTVQEFETLYFRVKEETSEPAAEADESEKEKERDGAELKLFSEVHVMLFALDTIGGRSGPWIDNMRSKMRKFMRFPENGQPMRMILLKYEDDNVSKLDVLHPHLDDLIYLPLDRLIFLQKLQILVSLPKRVSPTYLFNQEVKKLIEISKIVRLDRLSDVGLAIRNPLPLKKGVPGHFYLMLPGEKSRLEIHAKVLRSEPHPEYPGQYLVYFTYFGLSRAGLTTIRRALSKSPQYKSLLFDDRERFRYRADDLFIEDKDRKVFGVALIDSDEVSGNAVKQMMMKEMDRLDVFTESSYQVFLHRYLDIGGSVKDGTPPRASDSSDFYASPISMTINGRDLKCLSVDPGPTDESIFLGHPAAQVFSSPDKWISLVQEKESRLIMEEAAQLAGRGRVLEKLLSVQDAHNQRCAVNFKIYRGAAEGTVTIELSPASLADIVTKLHSDQKSQSLDAIILDTGFLPEDPASWLEGVRLRAAQVGKIENPKDLKVWLITDTERVLPSWLKHPDLQGLYVKPVDQRQLMFSLSENLPNRNTMYQFENLGWTSPAVNIHLSKDIELEALSEFGATLKSKQPMLPGTVIFLRKSIYDNAPNGCLAARVYACVEHPSDKDSFQMFTTYFGINDAFLKFARTWIRENYANQKAKE